MCAAALYISPSVEQMTEKNGSKLKKVVREIASIVAVSSERHRPAHKQSAVLERLSQSNGEFQVRGKSTLFRDNKKKRFLYNFSTVFFF